MFGVRLKFCFDAADGVVYRLHVFVQRLRHVPVAFVFYIHQENFFFERGQLFEQGFQERTQVVKREITVAPAYFILADVVQRDKVVSRVLPGFAVFPAQGDQIISHAYVRVRRKLHIFHKVIIFGGFIENDAALLKQVLPVRIKAEFREIAGNNIIITFRKYPESVAVSVFYFFYQRYIAYVAVTFQF